MTVALCATAIVVLALLWEISIPWLERRSEERRRRKAMRARGEAYGFTGLKRQAISVGFAL
jgi:hypothetical protein